MAGNGGIIGPVNTVCATCQAETITYKTASGSVTTQPGTTTATMLLIAGGGGGSAQRGGGGGAGGVREMSIPVVGGTTYCAVLGGGGAGSGDIGGVGGACAVLNIYSSPVQ